MKLSEQVCTLEQAKKLKELGVDARTIFNWVRYDHYPATIIPVNYYDENAPEYNPYDSMGIIHEEYSAYTVAEFGKALPAYVTFADAKYTLHIGKSSDGTHECGYILMESALSDGLLFVRNHLTQTSALAKALINLLESNLITPEQVNERLK